MSSAPFQSAVAQVSQNNCTLPELIGLADAIKQGGTVDEISKLYTLWISLNQNHPQRHVAQFNHAVFQSELGDLEGAQTTLESGMQQNPDFYPIYINLGNVMERRGKVGEAVNIWTALANRLGLVNGQSVSFKLSALKQIGRVLENNKLQPNAEIVLKQSLEINPHQQDVLQHFIGLRLAQCEWPIVSPWGDVDRETLTKGVGPLSMAAYTDDPMLQCASAYTYNRNFLGYPKKDFGLSHGTPKERAHSGRLKVGYVSSDLRNHAVGFIIAELFELHDRKNVEVTAYYCGTAPQDALTDRIKSAVEHWVDITGMTDEQAAQRVFDDKIDILIDVNGYTKDARTKLFAMRPAPVIVNWLGFPGTMASPYHHYIIADEWIIPPENERYFTEKVVHLPCYQPNDRKRVVSQTPPTRAEHNLPEDAFVFCSFNGLQKISRFTFDRWMRIMNQVPNSVLWLLNGDDAITQRLRDYAATKGVAPERFIFADKRPNPDHLARYVLADLFLDNQPYGAHVTASDALWMGVPIIHLSGRAFASRVTGSLLRAAGMPELICHNEEEFVARAVSLAKDPAELRRLKMKLVSNRDTCTLFDTPLLTRKMEELFRNMWADYRAGKLPVPDMRNLLTYLDVGGLHDHDAVEMRSLSDEEYRKFYRDHFLKRHQYEAIGADSRLWSPSDIAAAEGRQTTENSVVRLFKKKK